jgi:hypothetical protein
MSVRAAVALLFVGMTQAIPLEESAPEPMALPNTRIEAFLARGSSVVKQVCPIGSVRGLSLEALALFEPEPGKEPQKVKGLRAEIPEESGVAPAHSSYIDMDEIEGLLRAIDEMDRLLTLSGDDTELMFVTRGNFKLGCYRKASDRRIFASSGPARRADFLGKPEELPKIRELLRKALEKLRGL